MSECVAGGLKWLLRMVKKVVGDGWAAGLSVFTTSCWSTGIFTTFRPEKCRRQRSEVRMGQPVTNHQSKPAEWQHHTHVKPRNEFHLVSVKAGDDSSVSPATRLLPPADNRSDRCFAAAGSGGSCSPASDVERRADLNSRTPLGSARSSKRFNTSGSINSHVHTRLRCRSLVCDRPAATK